MTTIQINIQLILIIIALLFALIWMLLVGRPWLKARLSGIAITPTEIIIMRLRNSPVNFILTEQIKAVKSGVPINRSDLEACHLSGGDVKNMVGGLIFAKSIGVDLSAKEAIKLDSQKHDIVKYLKS